MMKKYRKTSMSVRDMGRLLGLKKTESFWLANKHYFEIVKVRGVQRVMIDSFEEWYQSQTHYRKIPKGDEIYGYCYKEG